MPVSICWWSAPACARALEYLECRVVEATPDEIAEAIHCSKVYARCQVMKSLLEAGVVHVSGRIRNAGGQGTPLYRLGPGTSVVIQAEPNKTRMRRRRREMATAYGRHVASLVLESDGYVVRDGRRLRTAGFGCVCGEVVRVSHG
jgi:hypothetical protein